MAYTVYVIEDERTIGESIKNFLEPYGYTIVLAKDFTRIIAEWEEVQPDLIVLDINLPYQNGFYLCQKIREKSRIPILILSARAGQMEQVLGMEHGADDYMVKPFHLEVLHAKIKALLRRSYGDFAELAQAQQIQVGELVLAIPQMEMVYRGDTQSLTKNEWKLLHLLLENADKVVARDTCLEALWDDQTFVDDNTLSVNVTRLRKKLQKWGLQDRLQTKRGIGYSYTSSEKADA
ncbi:response regulator transcription factor [Shimazuella sp. AN120528]|uniref:response regulator transcription factor n=1 Tax=Shimazuella soli TaxID=1892854 RepID=UPI001F1089B1|nr:response regulator transcription factor [Shimazuella soli]MCH5584765.1 response regulator transcription factor [Shimazuella soli]